MRFVKSFWRTVAERRGRAERDEPGAEWDLSLDLPAARVSGFLVLVAAVLVLASLAAGLVGLLGGPFVRLLDVGSDLSLPSWYSALVLALASVLLFTIAFAVRSSASSRYGRRWAILGIVFAYLSCDEMLRLHERMARTVLEPALASLGFMPGGILYYLWVIVYAPLVLVFAVAYFRFWRTLPTGVKNLVLAAGVIFVGGALGVELFNAYHDAAPGREPLAFAGTHVEEAMEMAGVIVFVHALITYLGSRLSIRALRLDLSRG